MRASLKARDPKELFRGSLTLQRQLQQRQDRLITELTLLGHHYAEQKDWHRAADLLRQVRALAPTQASARLAAVEQALAERQQQRRASALSALREQAEALLRRYQQSQLIDELIDGRAFLQRHQQDEVLAQLAAQFADLARQRFDAALKEGDALYSQGDYRQAQQRWQVVAPLFPEDPGLQARLQRVARVLNTIKTLSE